MIDNAIRAVPENALARLRKAQLLIDVGRGGEAASILRDLKQLPWSDVYYPRIRGDVEEMLELSREKAVD